MRLQIILLFLLIGAAFATTNVSIGNDRLANTKTVASAINQISVITTMTDTNHIYKNYTIHYYLMNVTNSRLSDLTMNLSNFIASNKIKLSNITLYTTIASALSPAAGKKEFIIQPATSVTIPRQTSKVVMFSFVTPNWQHGNFNFSIASEGLAPITIDPEIDACGYLTESYETYVLTKDVAEMTDHCFTAVGHGITLDCQGHTIEGWNSGWQSYYSAIYQAWEYGETATFTVKNCNMHNWNIGILLSCNDCGFTSDNNTIIHDQDYAQAGIMTDPAYSPQNNIAITNTNISINKAYYPDYDWAATGISISDFANVLIENVSVMVNSTHLDSCGIRIGGAGSNMMTINNATSYVPEGYGYPAFCMEGKYLADIFVSNSQFSIFAGETPMRISTEEGTAVFNNVSASCEVYCAQAVHIASLGTGGGYSFLNSTFSSPQKGVKIDYTSQNSFSGCFFNTSTSGVWVEDNLAGEQTNYFDGNYYRGIENYAIYDGDVNGYGDYGDDYPVGEMHYGMWNPPPFRATGIDYNPAIVTPYANYFSIGTDTNGSSVARHHITANTTATAAWLTGIEIRLYNSTGGLLNMSGMPFSPYPEAGIQARGFFVNWTGLPDGMYYFNSTATYLYPYNDGTIITAEADTYVVTIDTVAPNISIISPTNITYTSLPILVNISATGANNAWFNWNGTNTTYTSPVNISPANGFHTLYAWANDAAGNQNSTSVNFTVNAFIPPYPQNCTWIAPPSNNSQTNACFYDFQWSCQGANITSCRLNASGTVVNGTYHFNTTTNLSWCNATYAPNDSLWLRRNISITGYMQNNYTATNSTPQQGFFLSICRNHVEEVSRWQE